MKSKLPYPKKPDNVPSFWEIEADRIERRRENVARAFVVCIYAVLVAATVWAICALVSSLREDARLRSEAENAHYVRTFLEGGRQ